jgi:hypothetical protein
MGAPRSSQHLKDLAETSQARLMERSPGSPERAGFACSGVEAPSAAGFLGSARSQKLVAGLQITQLPNYPFTQWGSSQHLNDLAETSQAIPRRLRCSIFPFVFLRAFCGKRFWVPRCSSASSVVKALDFPISLLPFCMIYGRALLIFSLRKLDRALIQRVAAISSHKPTYPAQVAVRTFIVR